MTIAFTITGCDAKINNAKTETFKVYGNCNTCKKTIEKAIKQNKDAKGNWNKDTKMLTLTYDTKKTTADEILKRIADAGYDNDKYIANDASYNNLDECCQYDRKSVDKTLAVATTTTTKTDEMPKDMKMDEPAKVTTSTTENPTAPKVESPTSKIDFVPLLTQYYTLKNALVADNTTTASKSATALLTEINAIKMESMSTSEHTIWMKYFDMLKADATKISTTKDIGKQRAAFSSLSNNLWSTVKGLKIKDNGAIYVDYCPMKDAYWLSKESAIKNPYFGKQMLTCGSIKETIK